MELKEAIERYELALGLDARLITQREPNVSKAVLDAAKAHLAAQEKARTYSLKDCEWPGASPRPLTQEEVNDLLGSNEDDLDAEDREFLEGVSAHLERLEKQYTSPWIPVEDGLPEDDSFQLCTFISANGVLGRRLLRFSPAYYSDEKEWFDHQGKRFHNRVLAWMPLPEPYQPPKPVDPLTVMREALEEIASGDGVYGAQAYEYKQIAREALAKVKGEE